MSDIGSEDEDEMLNPKP